MRYTKVINQNPTVETRKPSPIKRRKAFSLMQTEVELKKIDTAEVKVENNADNSTMNDVGSPTSDKGVETPKKEIETTPEVKEEDGTLNSTQVSVLGRLDP